MEMLRFFFIASPLMPELLLGFFLFLTDFRFNFLTDKKSSKTVACDKLFFHTTAGIVVGCQFLLPVPLFDPKNT